LISAKTEIGAPPIDLGSGAVERKFKKKKQKISADAKGFI
jgi:hypothetical protein